jgi:hypothetical protein
MIEHLQGLPRVRILKALAGRLPAGAGPVIVRTVPPALERGAEHDESSDSERVRAGARYTAEQKDHTGKRQRTRKHE